MTKQDIIDKAKRYGYKDVTAKKKDLQTNKPYYLILRDEEGRDHPFPLKKNALAYFK